MIELITDSTQESTQRKRQGILADPLLMQRLDKFAKERGLCTRTKALDKLLSEYEASKNDTNSIPVATFENLMRNSENEPPAVISGVPGSGKSYTLDKFLRECKKRSVPFLLFNSDQRDHNWIANKISYAEVLGLNWLKQPGQYAVSLEHNLNLRKTIIEQISNAILMLEGDQRLEKWVLCFEEAHDYHEIEAFCSILRRMRKSTRKLIVVSTEAELFKMCRTMRPEQYSIKA